MIPSPRSASASSPSSPILRTPKMDIKAPRRTERTDDRDSSSPNEDGPVVLSSSQEHPTPLQATYRTLCVVLLLLSYFLSQYDKFIVSYFQTDIIRDLGISSAGYGALTGYGTSVLSSFTAIPIAMFTDRSEARVWMLSGTVIWWSLMVIFQGLSKQFSHMVCARLGMFFGQSASEAIAVSLISDLVPIRFIPLAESLLYVGVYIGEAISARISAVFKDEGKTWRLAFRAIGITGVVVAVVTILFIREPRNRRKLILAGTLGSASRWHWRPAASEVWQSLKCLAALRSFWVITLSASFRQLAGVIFGYYMPTLLQLQYPDDITYLVTTYGTIVGTVGTFACLLGGFLTFLFSPRHPTIALHLTAWGGFLSWPFVVILTHSRSLGGLPTLFGALAAAYITAELWLGANAAVVVSLLPIRYKTMGYAIYALVVLLVYSSGPEIVAIAQAEQGVDPTVDPERYIYVTRIILCVLIPLGYVGGGIGFLWASRDGYYPRDLRGVSEAVDGMEKVEVDIPRRRKWGFVAGLGILAGLVVSLTVVSYVLGI